MYTFKALGLMLTYPEHALKEALPEVRRCLISEEMLQESTLRHVQSLVEYLTAQDLMSLQENYVALFDRTRRLSLHLYEHLYGESRERGQAMARLATVYRMHGFDMTAGELPDYLPLLCEFLSLIEVKPARAILADAVSVLEALRLRLAERGSPYEAALSALLALADKNVDRELLAEILDRHPEHEESFEVMDDLWEEKPVTFGPENAPTTGCGASTLNQPRPDSMDKASARSEGL